MVEIVELLNLRCFSRSKIWWVATFFWVVGLVRREFWIVVLRVQVSCGVRDLVDRKNQNRRCHRRCHPHPPLKVVILKLFLPLLLAEKLGFLRLILSLESNLNRAYPLNLQNPSLSLLTHFPPFPPLWSPPFFQGYFLHPKFFVANSRDHRNPELFLARKSIF